MVFRRTDRTIILRKRSYKWPDAIENIWIFSPLQSNLGERTRLVSMIMSTVSAWIWTSETASPPAFPPSTLTQKLINFDFRLLRMVSASPPFPCPCELDSPCFCSVFTRVRSSSKLRMFSLIIPSFRWTRSRTRLPVQLETTSVLEICIVSISALRRGKTSW